MGTNTYVCQLPKATQDEIERDIFDFLTREGYDASEIQEIIENALAGRLVDLEENLDISKYK